MSWWRRGVVYEAYPRSFLDTDGDGVGDLRGITAQLPYLRWLGVDAVWLTPIYPSPQRDFGYDITDHTAIDPQFGTLDDFDALVAAAHRHGLRVILDYGPTTPPTGTRGSASDRTGTCGTTGRRPTTGSASSAARPGSRWASAATTTPTCASSPTSTGATPR